MSNQANHPVIACHNLSKTYQEASNDICVLNNVNLVLKHGEKVAIIGTSGSGKSTLLNLLAGLDNPTDGSVYLAGYDLFSLDDKKRSLLRNKKLGFVYQFHHLLAEFSALENVCMPALIAHKPIKEAKQYAEYLLDLVGLSTRITHKPAQLSGGERQRVAIARALSNKPQVVLLDEPTGNLDSSSANKIHELLKQLSNELGTAFLLVTHDLNLAKQMDRTVKLTNGALSDVLSAS